MIQTGQETVAERLLPNVRTVMRVDDVTSGGAQFGYAARFRGELMVDSIEAFERLEPVFKNLGMTLLFRMEEGTHVALAVPRPATPKPSDPRRNLILFALTVVGAWIAGASYAGAQLVDDPTVGLGRIIVLGLPQGALYALSLLAILLAHEFGHYLVARYHRASVSLPYFLPLPLPGTFGTLGAFIQMKEPPRNRRILLDIALAGPIAGLLVAIPIVLIGLSISKVQPIPTDTLGFQMEGNSILYLALKFLVKGELLPAPSTYGALSPVLYWIRYFFVGLPAPLGGRDVFLHPVAWAGWAGLLVTALNLIPAGQLDGGHAVYVLLGRRALRLWPFLVIGLVLLGLAWPGWFLWAMLLYFLGRTYAQPLDEITPLDPRRRWLAFLGVLLFLIVFIPVPLRQFIGI